MMQLLPLWQQMIRVQGLAGPVLVLGAYPLGGEGGMLAAATVWALLAVAALRVPRPAGTGAHPADARHAFLADLDRTLQTAAASGTGTACIVLQFDNGATLLDRHGRAVQTEILHKAGDRIADALRPTDRVLRLEGGGFAVALGPGRRIDLETLVQMSARLQRVVAEPLAIGGARYLTTCSAGFCLGAMVGNRGAASLLDAAQIAADEALRHGPGGLRAFSPGMARKRADRDARRAELETALDEGQIRPWFQPQLCADTGAVTGFEALARWQHPDRGLVPPSDFLPDILASGLSERLSEVMVFHALVALSRWDRAGFRVPCVGVNFSSDELRNPRLADKLRWELDRFDLTPDRLSVEVLESVIADTDQDVIVHNLTALARMGCRIDLDDFGTGHTSIGNIRRFAVHRLKIDRSFVAGVDKDQTQQQMVSAILSMAERLGLDTLAEGVETRGEWSMLSQLGCGHLQGFGVGRPMPFEATIDWLARHRAKGQTGQGGPGAILPGGGRNPH